MNIKFAAVGLVSIFFIAGCSTMKVTSEYDHHYSFNNIKTYQWIDGPSTILDKTDTYINEDIQKALSNELENYGIRQVSNTLEADVQIVYYVKLKKEQEYATNNNIEHDFSGGFVYSHKNKNWSYQEREPDLNVYTVEVGTLTMLVYATQTKERIWRGNLKTEIDRSLPKEKQELIRAAAKKLMSRFPKKT